MHAAPFTFDQNLTISDKNSCILNMKWGITKRTQINSSWTDITASLCQDCKTWKQWTEQWRNWVHKSKVHTAFRPSHTSRWFASTLPIRMVIQLTPNHWLRWPTANPLRMLNRRVRVRVRGYCSLKVKPSPSAIGTTWRPSSSTHIGLPPVIPDSLIHSPLPRTSI